MKIYAYRASSVGPGDLIGLLAEIGQRPHRERFFAGGIRLDSERWGAEFALFDFAAKRVGHGPGRMATERPIDVIELERDEYFGEDTGLAIHVPTGYMALQYNHYGPRAKAISDYLDQANISLSGGGTVYHLGACLRDGAYLRMLNFGIVQQIDVSIARPGVGAGAAGQGVSVGQALDAPLPDGVESFSISLKARRGQGMEKDAAIRFIDEALAMPGQVLKAVVWGKEGEGMGNKRPIDLLNEHLSAEVDIQPARGDRYARAERWAALQDTLRNWIASGQLQP